MGKTVLVLGGGIGGVVAAGLLRRRLGREHRVVLVDQDGRHVFSPSLPWFVTGAREPARFTRDLTRLSRRGIEVVVGEVAAIDPARPSATVNGRVLAADYLVLALGADLALGAIPGWEPAALNFYCLRGATMVREALAGFQGGKLALAIAVAQLERHVGLLARTVIGVGEYRGFILHGMDGAIDILRQLDLERFQDTAEMRQLSLVHVLLTLFCYVGREGLMA